MEKLWKFCSMFNATGKWWNFGVKLRRTSLIGKWSEELGPWKIISQEIVYDLTYFWFHLWWTRGNFGHRIRTLGLETGSNFLECFANPAEIVASAKCCYIPSWLRNGIRGSCSLFGFRGDPQIQLCFDILVLVIRTACCILCQPCSSLCGCRKYYQINTYSLCVCEWSGCTQCGFLVKDACTARFVFLFHVLPYF